jgi:hypothetical protein
MNNFKDAEGDQYGAIFLTKETAQRAGSVGEAILNEVLPKLVNAQKIDLLPQVVEEFFTKSPLENKVAFRDQIQENLLDVFKTQCEIFSKTGKNSDFIQQIITTVVVLANDPEAAKTELRKIADAFSLPYTTEITASTVDSSAIRERTKPPTSDKTYFFPGIGLIWEPSGGGARTGSDTFRDETPIETKVREPFRHLAREVMPRKGHFVMLHRTALSNTDSWLKSGLSTGGDYTLKSTASFIYSSASEGRALDSLLTGHFSSDAVLVMEVADSLRDKDTWEVDVFNDEGKVDPKYIKGYVNLMTKTFHPNPLFIKG